MLKHDLIRVAIREFIGAYNALPGLAYMEAQAGLTGTAAKTAVLDYASKHATEVDPGVWELGKR